MGEPWDQIEGETHKAYAAFSAYLALGPWRSHRALADKLYAGRIAGVRTIEGWSGRNRWVERARAWDKAQAALIREELSAQRLELARQVMLNAAKLNDVIEGADLRGVSAYTKMAMDASRTETGLPQSVGEVRHAGHDGGPLPTPDPRIPLSLYARAAQDMEDADE